MIRKRIILSLLALALAWSGWRAVQAYWLWGYDERPWPGTASVSEPAEAVLPSPRRTLLFERRWDFLGGPRLLAVIIDPESGEEMCRVPIREPGTGDMHWLETRSARHWGSRWSSQSLEDLTQ